MSLIQLDRKDLLDIREACKGRSPGFCFKADVIRADGTFDEGVWGHNWIVNTGYAAIWGAYFLNVTRPATIDIHLATACTTSGGLGSTTVVGDMTELTGATGYTTGTGVALNTGASTDFTLGTTGAGTAAVETCTANATKTTWTNSGTGTWTTVTYAYLTTPSAATLICAQLLDNSRTIYKNDVLNLTYVLTVEAP